MHSNHEKAAWPSWLWLPQLWNALPRVACIALTEHFSVLMFVEYFDCICYCDLYLLEVTLETGSVVERQAIHSKGSLQTGGMCHKMAGQCRQIYGNAHRFKES